MNLEDWEFLEPSDNLRLILLQDGGCSLQYGETLVNLADTEGAEADETGTIHPDPSGMQDGTRWRVQVEVDLQPVSLAQSWCGWNLYIGSKKSGKV